MSLTRKQIMVRKWGSTTNVMISISKFKKERKGEIIVITGQEIIPCPSCETGELFTRGTCHRCAINTAGEKEHYQLRVLQCRNCNKTHRELPEPLVPYKRYDGETIIKAANEPDKAPCDFRSVDLILKWLTWFIDYAAHIQQSLEVEIAAPPLPKMSGKYEIHSLFAWVKRVVNSGNWSHKRTELCIA